MKIVATNKLANFNYFLLDKYEAGVVLQGSEVKSIRQNGMTLDRAFILIKGNRVVLKNSFIKNYQTSNKFTPATTRDRFLLLHKNEILKLKQNVERGGLTIVPVKAYFEKDLLKIEIALARGKKLFNKKRDQKELSVKRSNERALLGA